MKKKKELTIKINFSNRFLYTFIVLGILAMVAVGVYAYGTSSPSNFGHSMGEIAVPTGCVSGQIISWDGTNLVCTNNIHQVSYWPNETSGATIGSLYNSLAPSVPNVGDTVLVAGGLTYQGNLYAASYAKRLSSTVIQLNAMKHDVGLAYQLRSTDTDTLTYTKLAWQYFG